MKSQKNFTYVSYLRSISCPFCTEKWFPRHKNAPKSNFYHPPSVAMIHLKRPLGKPLKPIETYQIHLFNYILWSIHIHFALLFSTFLFTFAICFLFSTSNFGSNLYRFFKQLILFFIPWCKQLVKLRLPN